MSSVDRLNPTLILIVALLAGCFALAAPQPALAQDHEDCLDCHDDTEFTAIRNGSEISLHVDLERFQSSVHADLDCSDCHDEADPDDLPHEDEMTPVFCGYCHDDAQADFAASIHGQALNRNAPYAPKCSDCHGTHEILSPKDPESDAYKMNVPILCGGCHREGASVARVYDIGEHNIVENYSQSIHGEGLFKKGLTVTAGCTDCHTAHSVMPHTDPRSSISPRRIAETCMQCHSQIEEVHTQVIRGELWEAAPGAIPSCTDCHLPHKVRKETLTQTLSDRECLKCHGEPDIVKVTETETFSMFVSRDSLQSSVHDNIPCVKCHADINPQAKDRPCETAGVADCSNCHVKMSEEYEASGHGQAFRNGEKAAPYCTTCHGDHNVRPHSDDRAPTFRASVPKLCGECHRTGGSAPGAAELSEVSALTDYSASVHGRGLTEKGLLPSAICIDCHGSHLVLKHTDERSSVSPLNVPGTCASCHRGIYKEFTKSIHFNLEGGSREKLPTCTDCHSAHTIGETGQDQFMNEVTTQCGSCHHELAETYLETLHGKAYQLGSARAAKCTDCHGAHAILSHSDPNSSVGFRNVVGTCQKCHEDANARFVGYLTHATHHDPEKYPILYWTFRAMTGLLIGVFAFFGLHTLFWLPRSFQEMREKKKPKEKGQMSGYFIRRFTRTQRITHLFVVTSFLSLALTGMVLKFSGMTWATTLASLMGGAEVAAAIHRIAAVVTFGYFVFHIIALARFKHRRRLTLLKLIFGKDSMMFNIKDIQDFYGTMKWFFGLGPKPNYGRWTYWEKFDYLAVFWGVAVIGLTGLMLWFPEFFTRLIPGEFINVAHIIHSDEALLAVGFIFTIHFFNTHLRPAVFPMDTVIFTGLTPLEEYKKERPEEYAEMKRTGRLGNRVVKKEISRSWLLTVRFFGFLFLGTGLILVALIIYSMLRGYNVG